MAAPAGVTSAAATTETAAKGAASGCWWVMKQIWRGLSACGGVFSRQVKKLPVPVVSVMLRVLNLANAVLLGAACYYAFQIVGTSITRVFLATYIGLFAIILALFETRVKYTAQMIRRMFGFMFTFTGRAIFLIFLGAICFGMLGDDDKNTSGYTWCLWVGIATLANALFNCFIICSHPGFQAANANPDLPAGEGEGGTGAGKDPSKLTDAQVRAYLEAHPELAVAAASAVTATPGQPSGAAAPGVAVGDVQEWGSSSRGGGASSGGGGFFGGFGRGGGAGGGGGKAKTPKGGDAETGGGGYAPPPVPAAQYVPPPVAAVVSPPPVPARSAAPPGAVVIDHPEDNPFASDDNPFAK